MWSHPATRSNVERLRSYGYTIVEPEEGFLASGFEGQGRLAETGRIVGAVVVVVESAGVSTVVAVEDGVVVDGTERLAGAVDEPESSLHAARVTMATATARTPWRHLRASAMR